MKPDQSVQIQTATEKDVPILYQFIRELAEYEHLTHAVSATEADLHEGLFGEKPCAEAILAYFENRPVGFALYFTTFSTFVGKSGLYLEDLYVQPEFRGKGIGKALLLRLVHLAQERGYGRMEWSVLNWNEPAIRFYQSMGAVPMNEWTVYRLTCETLAKLVEKEELYGKGGDA